MERRREMGRKGHLKLGDLALTVTLQTHLLCTQQVCWGEVSINIF